MKTCDVYSFGMISSSTMIALSLPFPPADGYAEMSRSWPMIGGEAANCSVVLSRLGLRVVLEGAWLGDNPEGRAAYSTLKKSGVDTKLLQMRNNDPGVREVVISDDNSRTILGTYAAFFAGTRKWSVPSTRNIASARIACIDPFFGKESLLASRLAISCEVPYVTVDCGYDDKVAQGAAAVVISGEYRKRTFPSLSTHSLLGKYQALCGGLIVLTSGNGSIWFRRPGGRIGKLNPPRVKVVDTTGAGDAFRAGVVYGIFNNWDDNTTVQYAAALAALVCTTRPGVLNSPGHKDVLKFLSKEKSNLSKEWFPAPKRS